MADNPCWCGHPRSWHVERLQGCPAPCCPLPCECLGFELAAPHATVYVAPPRVPDSLRDAVRQFGPGTTEGGRAEAGWLSAGRIIGSGPEILPRPGNDASGAWRDLLDP